MRTFETGATRNDNDDKPDYEGFLTPMFLEAFAQYMHEHRKQADGELRASDNWQKGIPMDEYMKSMWRHFMELWAQHRDQGWPPKRERVNEALCALMFNIQGYYFEFNKPDKTDLG